MFGFLSCCWRGIAVTTTIRIDWWVCLRDNTVHDDKAIIPRVSFFAVLGYWCSVRNCSRATAVPYIFALGQTGRRVVECLLGGVAAHEWVRWSMPIECNRWTGSAEIDSCMICMCNAVIVGCAAVIACTHWV